MNRDSRKSAPRKPRQRFPIAGIGASAGGLEAFTQLLQNFPADSGMALVLLQHLDPTHESELARLLARSSALPTREAANNMAVQPDTVYVIPSNTVMTIAKGVLKLEPRPEGRRPMHTIDTFFESLARDQAERAIGVVLSGTGSDGTLGLEAIKAEGGITFAQDDSAKYDSMPRSATAAGCVDFVLSPEDIAKELVRIARHPYVLGVPKEQVLTSQQADAPTELVEVERAHSVLTEHEPGPLPPGGHGTPDDGAVNARVEAERAEPRRDQEAYKKIMLLLRNHCGVDFTLYKSSTIQRRIARRMALTRHLEIAEYANFLRGNVPELDNLFSDVLISVTSFFRNPEAFELVKQKVLPRILSNRRDGVVRAWVLGCSTGQEAYTVAMAFAECGDVVPKVPKLQIFATDLNDALLEKARAGLYSRNLVADISPERLRRFFVEEDGGYRIIKPLRESIIFARQNMVTDPPFSKVDLICCRNVLIYLEPSLQKKAIPMFHYALNPDGFLFLGASESVGSFSDLFEPIDRKHKIYEKKNVVVHPEYSPVLRPMLTSAKQRRGAAVIPLLGDAPNAELSAQREADRLMVNEFAPPSVLINSELQILQFRGSTSAYLVPPRGRASFDLLKMVREGLEAPLQKALDKARKENVAVRMDNLHITETGNERTVNVQIVPLKNVKERCYLVLFEDTLETPKRQNPAPYLTSVLEESSTADAAAAINEGTIRHDDSHAVEALRRRLVETERQLAETRDYVQAIQEQHDAANEELQSTSEEAQSANEELQSINEELETSKEELESTNEELTTVNEEMSNRNAELNRLNADLNNLHVNIDTAILVLGRDLRVRRFTPLAENAFNLLPSDVGRPLSGIRHNLLVPVTPVTARSGLPQAPLELDTLIKEVIDTVTVREREVQDTNGRWYMLRVRPYMTLDNKIDGAVVALVDVDALKRSQQDAETTRTQAEATIRTRSAERFRVLAESMPQKIFTANWSGDMEYFNPQWLEYSGLSVDDLRDDGWTQLVHPDDLEENLRLWKASIATAESFEYEHRIRSADGEYRWHMTRALALKGNRGDVLMWVGSSTDIHDVKEADRRKDEFIAMMAHELRNALAPIGNALQILQQSSASADIGRSAVGMLHRHFGQAVRLMDDLLDISRMSRGKISLHIERLRLSAVLDQAVESIRAQVERLEQTLTVNIPDKSIMVNGDRTRLAQIVGNLLSNASKFTERHGRIDLNVETEGEQAVIRVRDTGIGISAEQLPLIFDMFVQVDTSLERTQGGLGIGLTLVKKLVEMHGGMVEAQSQGIGTGAEFVVRLPMLSDTNGQGHEAPAGAIRVQEPGAHRHRRILVVDDNVDSAISLATILKLSGHEVQTAHDGLEAVKAAGDFRPDIILLDIGLPKLNGYDAGRRIRQEHPGKPIVLVAVTGWGQDNDRKRSHEAGFDHHLIKPIDLVALNALLDSVPSSTQPPAE